MCPTVMFGCIVVKKTCTDISPFSLVKMSLPTWCLLHPIVHTLDIFFSFFINCTKRFLFNLGNII